MHSDAPEAMVDPFAWEPDPVVLVSRRPRSIVFPADLLRGEPTAEQVKRWNTPPTDIGQAAHRTDAMMAILPGVNFLGTFTSSWLLRTHDGRMAPQGPPPPDKCAVFYPSSPNGRDLIDGQRSGNRDRETGRLRPDKVRAIVDRVLKYCREHRAPTDLDLWSTMDGFDAPELQALRLSELFRQNSQEAAHAHASVTAAIPHLRRTQEHAAVLGALHDYALRDRAGSAILAACRRWWTAKKLA